MRTVIPVPRTPHAPHPCPMSTAAHILPHFVFPPPWPMGGLVSMGPRTRTPPLPPAVPLPGPRS